MNHQSTKTAYLSLCLGLMIALLVRVLTSVPALAAGAQKNTTASSQAVTTPNLTFTPLDVTFTYGVDTANGSLTVSNLGDGTAADVYLYVDFGVIGVTASSAPYTTGSNPYFKLPDIPAAGSYTLTFTLGYSNWCTSSAIERTLVWQPHYHDGRGNDFTSGVAFSSVQSSGAPHLQVSLSGASDVALNDIPVSYHVTSAYNGASNCGNGPMGQVAVVDTVPAGFIVEDTGGGTWIPGSGGTGGTLTWTHTRPAGLDRTFTLKATDSVACGVAFINAVTATCTDCAGAVPPATASQTSAHACGNLAIAQKTVTPAVCERCGESQYTNTYDFSGSVGATLNGLIFSDLAENQQQYVPGSLSAILDGSDITGCVIATDTTPGGTLGLDFSGCGAAALGSKNLTIAYRLSVTPAAIPACDSLSFFSNSELTLPGQTIYSVVPVQVQAPEMSLAISGLDAVVDKGESDTVTISLTSLADTANPRDARFVLSGVNYALPSPAAVVCSGSVSPISCTPAIVGSDYVWSFGDDFTGSGQNAVLELTVQKRVTGGGKLDARVYYDDQCNDDATSNDICSTAASDTPAVLRSGDLLIEVSPSVYPTAGKDIQWKTYVTNRGSGTAYNVWVDHVLGNGLAYASSTVDNPTGVTTTAAQDHSGGVLNGATTSIASLAPGERREITLNATRLAQNNLTYTASAAWGVLGVDGQTPVSSSSIVSVLPLIVTNANDGGPGSLRQTIADALAGDTITFADDYTITLSAALVINKNLTITGSGRNITISGNDSVRVFNVTNNTRTTLANLTLVHGHYTGGDCGIYPCGGGLKVEAGAAVTLTHSAILSSTVTGAGGGIYNLGTLIIQQSTVAGNSSDEGGGILHSGGALLVQQSTLTNNTALYGGGILVVDGGTVTLENSTLSGNTATGTASSGGGGAIDLYSGAGIIRSSTIVSNTAVSPNQAKSGIWLENGTLTLRNSIVANNNGANNFYRTGGTFTSQGYNLANAWNGLTTQPTDLTGDPKLGLLGDNGGKTRTYALLPSSPAIDAGDPDTCPATDQRGVARPQGARCDIGAYEALAAPTITTDPATGVTATSATLNGTANANGTATTLGFEYGPDTGYGSSLSAIPLTLTGSTNATFSAALGGLLPNTTYHFRAVGVNAGGTVNGLDATFTTPCASALTVTNANDSGVGSLRQAIADVCAGGTIDFAGDYTITLSSTLEIYKSLTITGSGHNVAISGDHKVQIFSIQGQGPTTPIRNSLTNLNLVNGKSGTLYGGGIYAKNCELFIESSTFSGNSADWDGGGIYAITSSISVENSTFSGNSADFGDGGGIYNDYLSTTSVKNSTFTNNTAADEGGALYSSGDMFISKSTFSGNVANYGGGVYTYSNGLHLVNSTLSGNVARFTYGGGLFALSGTVTLYDSLIANSATNISSELPVDCYLGGASIAAPYTSLIEDGTCGAPRSGDPLLAPLGNYGGPTQTFALLPGSPAIDAGTCLSADQRGMARVGTCDIGAFESQGFTLAKTGGDDQSALVNTAFANPLAVNIAANNPVEPVAGGVISFTAPTSGASIAVPTAFTGSIHAGGVVSATVTANGTIGGPYNVTARAVGANSVNFSLTNESTPAAPSGLIASPVSQTQINLLWTDNSSNETGFKITRDSVLITTTAANVTTYSDTGLACGTTYDYEVRATNTSGDSAGTTDSAVTVVCAPVAPVVITPANGSITNDNTPTISGTAEASSTITVTLDGASIGTTTADASGNWSYTVGSALSNGSHTVKATAHNAGGTSPDSNTNTFTVDATAPRVTSITRLDANPTGLAGVRFLVRFSEMVSGVDATSPFSDFSLAATGLSGATVTGISGAGAVYTVTVATGSGNGTLRLNISDDDTILDAAGNPLGGVGAGNGNFTTGESYTVQRSLLPGIAPSANPVDEGTLVTFTGSFSYPMLAPQAGEAISWDFGDGYSAVSVLAPTHTYGQSGLFTVILTVTDTNGIVAVSSLPLTVNNVAPAVDAGPGGTRLTGIPFAFHGSYTDPGWLETHTIAWSFGDGSLSFGSLTPSHSYATPGTYTATLTITDSKGGVGMDTTVVNVMNQIVIIDPGDNPDDEWSDPITSTTPCGNTFIGEFGSQNVTLTLQSLPAHTLVTVSFDLFIIRSWDGNRVNNLPALDASPYAPDGIIGPDIWQFQAAGNTLLRTTFSNWTGNSDAPQAYPGSYPGGSYPAQTGASAINSLCYTYGPYDMSSVYQLQYTFAHTGDALVLDFAAMGLQVISDESWGLDNVKVSVSTGNGKPYTLYLPIIVR